MLLSAVNIAGSVFEDSVHNPWNLKLPEGYDAVVNDLKKAYDVFVIHRKDARDTSERWFGVASVESSLLLLESPRVSKVFGSPILLKSERWGICPSSFRPCNCPARVVVPKVHGRGNGKRVRRPPQLQSSVGLSLTMSWWC